MAIQTVIIPGSQNLSFGVPGTGTQLSPILVAAGSAALQGVVTKLFESGKKGSDVVDMARASGAVPQCGPECPPGFSWSNKKNCCVKTRRRRRRMLTCTDKEDIAYLTATLGKGEMGKSAVGQLLAGACR